MSQPLTSHEVAKMLLANPDTDVTFPVAGKLRRVHGVEQVKRDGDGQRFLVLDDGESQQHAGVQFMGRLNLQACLSKPTTSFQSGPSSNALTAAKQMVGALDDVIKLLRTIESFNAKLDDNEAPCGSDWIQVCLAAENASLSLGLSKED